MTRAPARPAVWWAVVCGAVAAAVASPWVVPPQRVHVRGPLVPRAAAAPDRLVGTVDAVYDSTGRSSFTLHLSGLVPGRPYVAYAYSKGCGAAGDNRYQAVPDPQQPSSDPRFSNPRNELWFTGTSGSDGAATSTVRRDDQFSPERRPHSVVVEGPPVVRPNGYRLPGARLACLTVGF